MTRLELQVNAVDHFAEGRSVGDAGRYLRIRGTAKGELDPNASENRVIADLDKAARNARGLVEYETDFFILRPADPSRTSGVFVYDVTNRGRKMIMNLLDDAPADADAMTRRSSGILGSASPSGGATASSGQDGIREHRERTNSGLAARVPTAFEDGKPMVRWIRDEFHIGTRAPSKGDIVRLNYPATATDRHMARLTVRDRESDARSDIPSAGWEFVDRQTIRLLPLDTYFSRFKIYVSSAQASP